MDIKKFLEEYTIAKQRFAELTHVGLKTFNKYISGETIREDSRERIERGIRITIENNLKCPVCENNADWWTNHMWNKKVREYEATFKRLFEKDQTS